MDLRLTRRAVAASACAGALTATIGATVKGQESASPVASPAPVTASFPDTPAGAQLAWVLAVLNGDEPIPDETTVRNHFDEVILGLVPAAQLIATFEQLKAQMAPVTLVEFGGIPAPLGLDALLEAADGTRLVVSMTVGREAPYLITGLVFLPADQEATDITALGDWSELEAALADAGPEVAIFAAEFNADGVATPVHELNPESAMPIGSAFKLYVLGAVAGAIERAHLAWTDEIEVTEDVVSLPSGVTQNELFGTSLPIDELARRMISISDNTATDMLMHTVGREACEAALEELGNSVPERNIPFLTTREMFTIKLSDPALLEEYVAGDADERRELLEMIDGQPMPPVENVLSWDQPIAIDTVEWLATMEDLSRAMIWLWQASERPGLEPIRKILTLNPGVPADPDVWPVIAFKGGSEVGVMALSWLMERADDRLFTYAVTVSNPNAPIDEQMVVVKAAGAFPLLAEA
jgi:hypothetical protein